MDKLDDITKDNFARLVEIVTNMGEEFPSLYDRMWAASSRVEIWENEMADAHEELENIEHGKVLNHDEC